MTLAQRGSGQPRGESWLPRQASKRGLVLVEAEFVPNGKESLQRVHSPSWTLLFKGIEATHK